MALGYNSIIIPRSYYNRESAKDLSSSYEDLMGKIFKTHPTPFAVNYAGDGGQGMVFGHTPSSIMECGPFAVCPEGVAWPARPDSDCIWLAKFISRDHMLAFLRILDLQDDLNSAKPPHNVVRVATTGYSFVLNLVFSGQQNEEIWNADDPNRNRLSRVSDAFFATQLNRLYLHIAWILNENIDVPDGLHWITSAMGDYLSRQYGTNGNALNMFLTHPMVRGVSHSASGNQIGVPGGVDATWPAAAWVLTYNYTVRGASAELTSKVFSVDNKSLLRVYLYTANTLMQSIYVPRKAPACPHVVSQMYRDQILKIFKGIS